MLELYLFTVGATVYRYTSADRDVTYDSATWTAVTLGRGDRARETSEDTKNVLELTVPHNNPVAMSFINRPPKGPVTLKLYRGADVESIALILTANVSGVRWSGHIATIECQSPMVEASRNGLRSRYQTQCRHALYSRGCGVNKASFSLAFTFVSLELNSKRVRVTTSTALADGYAVGGVLEIGGERRLILDHASIADGAEFDVYFDIIRPFSATIAAGATVTAFAGCDHSTTVCRVKFSNLANFGGFPVIPKVNPFERSLNLPTD